MQIGSGFLRHYMVLHSSDVVSVLLSDVLVAQLKNEY